MSQFRHRPTGLLLILCLGLMAGCRAAGRTLPTPAVAAPTVVIGEANGVIPATWTPETALALVSPTPAGLPSRTPKPTNTLWPTATNMPSPTATPSAALTETPSATPTETPTPTPSTPAISGGNLLPNASFEDGWYHINQIPELQVPNQWTLEWDTGFNPLDPDPWNEFVRPESRVLNRDFLPASEHDLFIWDGDYTVKIFKGQGALSFRLLSSLFLPAGSYLMEVNVFPDLIEEYGPNGEKIWASDPLSGEVRFFVDSSVGSWILPIFGQRNTFRHAFEVPSGRVVRLGVAFRGRWAILNNGWFMDDWSLQQLATGE